MDKISQLWIRACKSKSPTERVHSIYRRFYCSMSGDDRDRAITGILSVIVDEHTCFPTGDLITKLSPNNYVYGEASYYSQSKQVMMATIRQPEKSCFTGLTSPLKFRV